MKRSLYVLSMLVVTASQAAAQSSSESKSFGMNLPSSSSNYGSDEVRAADGTTCRTSMSGNGPRFDMGAIGVPGQNDRDSFSAIYGRIFSAAFQAAPAD